MVLEIRRNRLDADGILSFNRASQRSGSEAAELPLAEVSFLGGALRKIGAGAMLEEIGWTPIRLRRWLRVKRGKRAFAYGWAGCSGVWLGVPPALAGIMNKTELIRIYFASGIDR